MDEAERGHSRGATQLWSSHSGERCGCEAAEEGIAATEKTKIARGDKEDHVRENTVWEKKREKKKGELVMGIGNV